MSEMVDFTIQSVGGLGLLSIRNAIRIAIQTSTVYGDMFIGRDIDL